MKYICYYYSPLGKILLASDGTYLTGLWFEGQKYYAAGLSAGAYEKDLPVFAETGKWLDIYFSGEEPDFMPELDAGGTDFQKRVTAELLTIPRGKTVSYGEIARRISEKENGRNVPARAVGTAVGKNRISVIVPCHRVVGKNGSLTGYAGGLDRKKTLLMLETGEK